jgi:hypothetical protein
MAVVVMPPSFALRQRTLRCGRIRPEKAAGFTNAGRIARIRGGSKMMTSSYDRVSGVTIAFAFE